MTVDLSKKNWRTPFSVLGMQTESTQIKLAAVPTPVCVQQLKIVYPKNGLSQSLPDTASVILNASCVSSLQLHGTCMNNWIAPQVSYPVVRRRDPQASPPEGVRILRSKSRVFRKVGERLRMAGSRRHMEGRLSLRIHASDERVLLARVSVKPSCHPNRRGRRFCGNGGGDASIRHYFQAADLSLCRGVVGRRSTLGVLFEEERRVDLGDRREGFFPSTQNRETGGGQPVVIAVGQYPPPFPLDDKPEARSLTVACGNHRRGIAGGDVPTVELRTERRQRPQAAEAAVGDSCEYWGVAVAVGDIEVASCCCENLPDIAGQRYEVILSFRIPFMVRPLTARL